MQNCSVASLAFNALLLFVLAHTRWGSGMNILARCALLLSAAAGLPGGEVF